MGWFFLAQWIIKRFQIKESSLCLKEYLFVLLRNTLQFHFLTINCVRMSRVKVKVDFLENHQSLFIQTQKSLHRPTSQSKGCRRLHHPPHQPALLATGSTTTLQTTLINEMLSFYFSRFCLSQSQGSRQERDFCSLNLRVRDENEIFAL